MKRHACYGVPQPSILRRCDWCGLEIQTDVLRYYLPRGPQNFATGEVFMPHPHRAPDGCGRQCASSAPVLGWTEAEGVHTGKACSACAHAAKAAAP